MMQSKAMRKTKNMFEYVIKKLNSQNTKTCFTMINS